MTIDPGTIILSKTAPADLKKTLIALDKLVGKADNSIRRSQFLPFKHMDAGTQEPVPGQQPADDEERPFLMCSYNKDQNSYRSPWTNQYFLIKKTADGEDIEVYEKDSEEFSDEQRFVRMIEVQANVVWEAYTKMYYGSGSISSVFLRPRTDDKAQTMDDKFMTFEGIFGIQKKSDNGHWDSVHIIKVDIPNEADKTCDYHVESMVTVSLDPFKKTNVSCTLSKEVSKTLKVRFSSLYGSHLENLGQIIEDIEIEFRSRMERVDMPKTCEVIESIYRKPGMSATAHLFGGAGGDADGGPPMMLSGMGVGRSMIGEIANKVKSKQQGGGPNPFMMAMESNVAKKKNSKDDDAGAGDQYLDLKKGLKKGGGVNPLAGEAMAALKKKGQGQDQGAKYNDLKAGLKKTKK